MNGQAILLKIEAILRETRTQLDSINEHRIEEALKPFPPEEDPQHRLAVFLKEQLSKIPEITRISVEHVPNLQTGADGLWAVAVPLSGVRNHATRFGTTALPYAASITVLQHEMRATFADIIAAAVIDLRSGDLWSSYVANDTFRTTLNGQAVHIRAIHNYDPHMHTVVADLFRQENRTLLGRMYPNQNALISSLGATAYEMVLVASEHAIAYISDHQRHHELGAGYALVKGAGGVAVDFRGTDLSTRTYDIKTHSATLLAANTEIAAQLLNRMK